MRMNSNFNFINLIKSIKFRIFIVVLVTVILPTIIGSGVLLDRSVSNYVEKKIDRFYSNNTILKNNIVNESYLDNQSSSIVNAQISQLAGEYNCRVEVINSMNIIVKDTNNSEEGKTSISDNVIRALNGDDVYEENGSESYVEFALPIRSNQISADGKNSTKIAGVLYINYSMTDVVDFRNNMQKYVLAVDLLIIIFGILMAWLCSVIIGRPIGKIERTIERVVGGHMEPIKVNEYSEIQKVAREFNQMVEKIDTQEKARQEFVSNVSHELKTPITSMKVLADSLIGQEGIPEELYQDFLEDISKEIDRENDIITDLLALVRMEKSEKEINISSVNINEILETVLKRLKPIAATKNIELLFESFRPVIADVDEVKFASVVNNLVENAIKYNNTDGTVTASLNSDHQYFYLKVSDTGIGISEEDQERVFERFFRVDKARARETGGTGLGLAITREIVLRHHGSIKIHSKEGEGTTFTVRIPLKYIQ